MIKEERVKIQGEVELGATISYKEGEGKKPAVIIIGGTGNLNRDGNGFGIKWNLYKNLADIFANNGYVCIRYDKRGTHESEGKYVTNSLTNLVDDAKSVIEYAKSLDIVDEDKIVVCGHSEGGMIATLLTDKTDVKGIILLSGAGMSLKEAMLYQNSLVIKQAEEGKGFINFIIRKTTKPEVVEKQVDDMFAKAFTCKKPAYFYKGAFLGTQYMKEHALLLAKDYINYLKQYSGEILAITGKKDLQADYTKLEDLQELDNIEIFTPENMNHVLKDVDDDNLIINVKKQYARVAKEPISQELIDIITSWMKSKIEVKDEDQVQIETSPTNSSPIIQVQVKTQTNNDIKKR